eukprot:2639042-Rhodomonas_salina.1
MATEMDVWGVCVQVGVSRSCLSRPGSGPGQVRPRPASEDADHGSRAGPWPNSVPTLRPVQIGPKLPTL